MSADLTARTRLIANPPLIGLAILSSLVVAAWGSFFAEKALYRSYVAAFETPLNAAPTSTASVAPTTDETIVETVAAPAMDSTPVKPETDLAAIGNEIDAGSKPLAAPQSDTSPEHFAQLSEMQEALRASASLVATAPLRDAAPALGSPSDFGLAGIEPSQALDPELFAGEFAGIDIPSSLRPIPRPDALVATAPASIDAEGETLASVSTMNSASILAVPSSLRPQPVPQDLRVAALNTTPATPAPSASQSAIDDAVQVASKPEPSYSRNMLIGNSSCGRSLARQMPNRRGNAQGGSAFIAALGNGSGSSRDNAIINELARGNMPGFLHDLQPVVLSGRDSRGSAAEIVICVTPDYLALGSDRDFVRVPLGLPAASSIAGQFNMMLPTSRMVDAIYAQAPIKLSPKPMQAGPQMSSTDYFLRHNATVEGQRQGRVGLIAGHKKDVVMANRMASNPGRVAIYGWHRSNGNPIQPVSTVHGASYADYSHGIRLVSRTAYLNGRPVNLEELLSSGRYAYLLNNDGPMPAPVIRVASR